MPLRLLTAALLLAFAARAGDVRDELNMSSTQSTDASPRAGNVSDQLTASFDLSQDWTVSAGAAVTLSGQTPAQERGGFGSSGNAVSLFSLGVDWDATESLNVGVVVDLSPKSTQFSGTQLVLRDSLGKQTTTDAQLRAVSSQVAGGLELSYDTAGDSDLEWSFSGGVTVTHFATDQAITRVRASGGLTAAEIRTEIQNFCKASRTCANSILNATRGVPASLDSERLSLSATATVWKDTDLTLAGDYYHYEQDPLQVGFFGVAAAGRASLGGGNGIPIAPVRFMVRPEVMQRFGDFSAKVWVQAGRYVDGGGQGTSGAGLKLQYKFSKAFKSWITLSGQRDLDEQGVATRAGTAALGAGYRF
jgi:hypothetical protein